ncbi:MAG: oligosaccharide flippase family protein [Burkholderiales bacterium]|nr:oligosaccharide flippase family protein [Burkholderiales bacterium]
MHASNALSRLVHTFRERLLSGFSWNVLSAIALQGSVLLSSIVVARVLGLTSFGAYSILVSTVMTVAAIAQGGSGLVATKYVAEFLASEPDRVGRVLNMCRVFAMVTGACTAALVFAAAGVISGDLLGRPELAVLMRLAAAAVFFQVSVSYQFGALQGFGAFRELSRAGVLTGLGHIAFTIIGAWLGQLTGALLGFVLASAFRTAVFAYVLKTVRRSHGVPESSAVDHNEFRLLWRFALPAGLAGFVTMPCLWLVMVLVARLPDGLGLVAILSVAHQVRLAALQLPSLLNAVSFSVLSRLKGLDETLGFRRVFWSNLAMNVVFSTLVVALLILAADPVMRIYGREFAGGRWVLVLLLVSVLIEMLAMTFYQLIQSAGRMWQSLFLIGIPRDFLYLLLASQLLPTFGLIGAGYAYLAAWTFALLAILVTIRRSGLL